MNRISHQIPVPFLQECNQVDSSLIPVDFGQFQWIPDPFLWIPADSSPIPVESRGIRSFLQES